MAIGDSILDAYGTSWTLSVGSCARLYYDHPVFGLLEYVCGDLPWECDNVNTLYLSQKGSLPDGVLPATVCIRPKMAAEATPANCGCYDLYDPSGDEGPCYDTKENQKKCCDPCCDCVPWTIERICGSRVETCEGVACKDDLVGVDNPSGPSYTMRCVLLNDPVAQVIYCSEGQWKVDTYCGDPLEFCSTRNYPLITCCPLYIGFQTADICCDCPPEGCSCCIDEETGDPIILPDTLTLSAVSGLLGCPEFNGLSVTLTKSEDCLYCGSASVGSCGTLQFRLQYNQMGDGSCAAYFDVGVEACDIPGSIDLCLSVDNIPVDCPSGGMEFTSVSWNAGNTNCGCCGGLAGITWTVS